MQEIKKDAAEVKSSSAAFLIAKIAISFSLIWQARLSYQYFAALLDVQATGGRIHTTA